MKRIVLSAIGALTTRERRRFFRLLVLQALVSLADIASLALLLALIHYYTDAGSAHASIAAQLFRYLQAVHPLAPLPLLLGFFLLKNAASFRMIQAQYAFTYGVAARISEQKLLQYLHGSYADYTQLNPAVHVGRISYQPIEYSTFVLTGIQQLALEAALTVLATAAILAFNAKLFLLLLAVLLPPVALSALYARKRLSAARGRVKESAEQATQHLHEALGSYVESNVFHRSRFFATRYASSQKALSGTLANLQVTQAIPPRFIELAAVLGLVVLLAVSQYNRASVELVNIGAFLAAAYKIIPGIARIANTGAQMRMYAHTIGNASAAVDGPEPGPGTAPLRSIVFQDVAFRYTPQSPSVRIDLVLERGDFAGLSSDSGTGKTTLVNLLLGFLEPDRGTIRFDGQPTTAAQRQARWPAIAYVKQQPFLLHDSLRHNITLDDAAPDEQRLRDALSSAGLDGFIAAAPEGLDMMITDGGKNISGGQRQRIALARALYKDADLLLLDEPFSELDAPSERAILSRLQALAAAGKMIVLITHNAASLRACTKRIGLHA